MKIAVRADAGVAMGTGHVMRCITLLEQLQRSAIEIDALFICRDHDRHLASFIESRGYSVRILPINSQVCSDKDISLHARWLGDYSACDALQTSDAINSYFSTTVDWLIVDHYGIDAVWHRRLRSQAARILVIDDLADRRYECDLLLDQTYGVSASRYQPLVSGGCLILAGTRYALLRKEFQLIDEDVESLRLNRWPPRKLLISLGGGDPDNFTGEILDCLADCRALFDEITVVVGNANPNRASLQQRCQRLAASLRQDVNNMAELLMDHDVAIGAAGTSSWERCTLGLPSLVLVTAENQKLVCSQLEAARAIKVITTPINTDKFLSDLTGWLSNKQEYMSVVNNALAVCDGLGSKRVSDAIFAVGASTDIKVMLRAASIEDCDCVYAWQSRPETRKYFVNSAVPRYEDHCEWFSSSLKNDGRELFIIEYEGDGAGVLRLDRAGGDANMYEISILVSPEFYKRGIAKSALVLAQYLWPEREFFAYVKSQNKASFSLFRSAGFYFDGEKFLINR